MITPLLRDDVVRFEPDGVRDGCSGCDVRNTSRRDAMASAYYNHSAPLVRAQE